MESVLEEDEEKDPSIITSAEIVTKTSPVEILQSSLGDGEEYDTDLETEQETEGFDVTGRNLYLSACTHFCVVPASYFIRHMQDPELVMKHHGLGALGVKALALALQNNTHVISLDLESNWIDGIGATYIAQMLKENIYISDLNLANNNLGSLGAAQLCEMLIINTTLQGLNISGNNFTDMDAALFVEALIENRRLQYLNLSHNQFGERAAFFLGPAIGENETLEELDLSWNYFRTKGAIEMCYHVKHNARLKSVNLSFNGLGLEGGLAVADIIKVNNVILQLDVSHSRIPEECAALISKNLESNDTLKVLRIGNNPLGVEGVKNILKGISPESNIIELLDMSGIEVDTQFLAEKEQFLQVRKKTTVLHGRTIGDYIIKEPPKSKLRVLLTTSVDDVDVNNILTTIRDHCMDKSFPIKDYFSNGDKNVDKMSVDDVISTLKQTGVVLGDDEVKKLTTLLRKVDHGGVDVGIFLKD